MQTANSSQRKQTTEQRQRQQIQQSQAMAVPPAMSEPLGNPNAAASASYPPLTLLGLTQFFYSSEIKKILI